MSEQLTHQSILEGWEKFFEGSPKRFVRIKDLDTNQYVQANKQYPSKFYKSWILSEYTTVSDWLDDLLLKNNLRNIQVLFRQDKGGNGTASHPNFKDTVYDVSNRLAVLKGLKQKTMENTPVPTSPKATETPNSPSEIQTATPTIPQAIAPNPYPQLGNFGLGAATMQGMGGTALAAQAAGLGFADFVELKKKAERADEYKDELTKLKDENHALVIKNRELESKASLAESKESIAVQMARLEKQGFLDGPAGQKLLESLPAILEMVSNNGKNAQQQGLAMPEMSPEKKEFMTYLADPEVTTAMVNILGQELLKMTSDPGYVQQRSLTKIG